MTKCKLGNMSVVITRAYQSNDAQKLKGTVAKFSFKLVDPDGVDLIVFNNFTLSGGPGAYKVFSPWRVITDHDAPEEIPDEEAVKPLYFTSFFPGAKHNPKIAEAKKKFFNDLAEEVFDKIAYFQSLKSNELSNTNK